jgi:hypothetical protein
MARGAVVADDTNRDTPGPSRRPDGQSTWSSWALGFFLTLCALASAVPLRAQIPTDLKVAFIDFFGLRRLTASQLRPALTVKEGDALSFSAPPAFIEESQKRLEAIPGVAHARLELVCCDTGVIVYVGIEEQGTPALQFHAAPQGAVRLNDDVLKARDDFEQALLSAVQRGQAQEDRTQGHSLPADPAMRAAVDRFIVFARRDEKALRDVLRNAGDAHHRAVAAQVLAYVDDKQTVVDDLVYATSDPDSGVRNDATRALLVFAEMQPGPGRVVPRVPFEPFVAMLNSVVWSDRNKASGALAGLSQARDQQLFTVLRRDAMPSLVEMARWKSWGHAAAGMMILARMAGYPEDAVQRLTAQDREAVIAAAVKGK